MNINIVHVYSDTQNRDKNGTVIKIFSKNVSVLRQNAI